jgi:membrane-bound ClpP family serine protease
VAEPSSANKFVEDQLDNRLQTLEDKFTAHAVTFCGPILFGVDDLLRTAVEERHARPPGRNKLIVLLTTTGGYIEVVQRMVDTLRHHYSVVDFIVPNHAFSAGTVFVMSGDAIHMDYYSRLGPIDPQVEAQSGKMVPALGYLEKYRKLIEKAQNGEITTAEVTLLVDGFDQAELYQ